MASQRRQEKEIRLVLKKIDEGLEAFDRLYDKVKRAEDKSSKLRYEGDLKKEIKRLQRHRDQVKVWINSPDVKDKSKLIAIRKVIERKMESFKAIEKETKTKQYSKVGLAKAGMMTEQDLAIEEMQGWIKDQVDELKNQVELTEAEVETLSEGGNSKKKKKGKSRNDSEIENLQEQIDQHNWHITNLTSLSAFLKDGKLQAEDIEVVKDDVEYYVSSNTEPEFYADNEIYENLLTKAKNFGENGHDYKSNVTNDDNEDGSSSSAATSKNSRADSKSSAIASSGNGGDNLLNIGKGVSKKDAQAALAKIKNTPTKSDRGNLGIDDGNSSITSNTSGNNKSSDTAQQEGQGQRSLAQGANLANDNSTASQQENDGVGSAIFRRNKLFLNASYKHIPTKQDSERAATLSYTPRNPYPTPPSFPKAPSPFIENTEMFDKFDVDTLFFVFYFQQGTYQQHLAAKQLKKRSWRYHKKYNTWFQRHEEITKSTDEYEQGTYVYFDFESGWCQRIKKDFTFEYIYLEDELK